MSGVEGIRQGDMTSEARSAAIRFSALVIMVQHVAMRWAINAVGAEGKELEEVYDKVGPALYMLAKGGSGMMDFLSVRVMDGNPVLVRDGDSIVQRTWLNLYHFHYGAAETIFKGILSGTQDEELDANAILTGMALTPLPDGVVLSDGEDPAIFDDDDPELSDEARDELQLTRSFNMLIDLATPRDAARGLLRVGAEELSAIHDGSRERPSYDDVWRNKAMDLALKCLPAAASDKAQ